MKKSKLTLTALSLMMLIPFTLSSCGKQVTDLRSVYELAVENGYQGTYEQWVEALKGDKGDTGAQGPKGDKGDTGATGEQGPKGDKGDTGATGEQGPKGDKGDTGAQGPKGDTGVSITKIEKTSSEDGVDTYTITFSDGTTTTYQVTNGKDGKDATISISADGYWVINGIKTEIKAVGEKGDKGDKGDTGEKGDKGDTGAQGPKGDKGDTGAAGDKGEDGVSVVKVEKTASADGVDTYTITYSNGTTSTFQVTNGKDGKDSEVSISEDGYWIINGVKTELKAVGEKGDKGDKGDTGETGAAGEKGDKGDTGAKGDKGDQGIAGEKGDKGDAGEKGEDGTKWITGSGIPNESVSAKLGDFYFDTDSGCVYSLEEDGWELIYEIAKKDTHTYKVTLDLNGGVADGVTEFTVPYGGFVEELPEPTKVGFEFVGFYTGLSRNDSQFTRFTPVYRDMDLIAVYEPTHSDFIEQYKNEIYNIVYDRTAEYQNITSEQWTKVVGFVKRIENCKTSKEADAVMNEFYEWINTEFSMEKVWKQNLKAQIKKLENELDEEAYAVYHPYFERISNSIDNWDDQYLGLNQLILNVAQLVSNDFSRMNYPLDITVENYQYSMFQNAFEEIKTELARGYNQGINSSDEWNALVTFFKTGDTNVQVSEFLDKVCSVMEYIPGNIGEISQEDKKDALKQRVANMKEDLQRSYDIASYEGLFDKINVQIENSKNDVSELINSELGCLQFNITENKQATDEFDETVCDFTKNYIFRNIRWGNIKFTTDMVEQVTSLNYDAENAKTVYTYLDNAFDFAFDLNSKVQQGSYYQVSYDIYNFVSYMTETSFKKIRTYMDSYLNRAYKVENLDMMQELDLLVKISTMDAMNEEIHNQLVIISTQMKNELTNMSYVLADEAEFNRLCDAFSVYDSEKTMDEYMTEFDAAMDYLFNNAKYDEAGQLESQKESIKQALITDYKFKGDGYDFTAMKAYSEFIARVDACKTEKEIDALFSSPNVLFELIRSCCKEDFEQAKLYLPIFSGMMDTMLQDDQKQMVQSYLDHLAKDDKTVVDSLIDFFLEVFEKYM